MSRPASDGSAEAAHLEAAAGNPFRGKPAEEPLPEMVGPECPGMLIHVLEWFGDLSDARTSSGFGVNPITWGDMGEWSRLTGVRPSPYEVDCIRRLDRLFRLVRSERKPRK